MPAPPPRVLHVDTATEWRGGQVQLHHLLVGMAARGWPARVACPEDSPLWHALDGIAERMVVPPGRSLTAARLLAASGADVIAAHTSHAHSMAAIARQLWGYPLVVHRRVDFLPSGGWKYRRPDGYIAVSNAVANIVKRAGGSGVTVVYDGVLPLEAAPPAQDGPTVLAVGARVPHKGHSVLSEAAALLPGVDIGVAGEGPLVYPGIRWLGHRDDISGLHAAARVFVHASVEEGMGQAVVEAMLAGVPVVVTDAGGLPEVVGETGIVVPRGDPVALAEALRRALAGDHPDPERARQRALERFSVDGMVDGSLAVYARVVAEKAQG